MEKMPLIGVFYTSSFNYIFEDIDHGIDLQFEEHLKECSLEDHEDCECWYDSQEHDILIGYKKNEQTGLYEIDETAEWSGIYRGTTSIMQVTHSIWGILGAPCSPCYPNQIDGDTAGELLGYAPPPDLIDIESVSGFIMKNRIFELKQKGGDLNG